MLITALVVIAAIAAFLVGMAYGRSTAVAGYRTRLRKKLLQEAETSADPHYNALVLSGEDPFTQRMRELDSSAPNRAS